MSRIAWPDDVKFNKVVLLPEDRTCPHCGRYAYIWDHRERQLHSLRGALHLVHKVAHCPEKGCPGNSETLESADKMLFAPARWSVDWDLFAWMGHRRFARHWSVPQIRAELRDTFKINVSADLIEDYTARYEVMVAAREGDIEQLALAYRGIDDLILTIDGLQPEKGHECLYVVRELRGARIWFAEALLSSAAEEIHRLFVRARDIAERLGKRVHCWVSDKQAAFVSGVEEVFPGVIHRYCQNHFLRDVAKPVLEADSQAKVQMRRKVRGLRGVERQLLAEQRCLEQQAVPQGGDAGPDAGANVVPATAAATTEITSDDRAAATHEVNAVALDYCAAVRGILNDGQGGPLHPPGVRMAQALVDVQDSIGCVLMEKKGGPAHKRCKP